MILSIISGFLIHGSLHPSIIPALSGACCVSPSQSKVTDSAITTKRKISKLSDQVRMIRHPDAPDGFPNSNTIVLIGKDAVMVIDSCYMPGEAKQDIEEIKRWTKKPVKYLVNTHWHYDHVLGNHEYRKAFPNIKIISHPETKELYVNYTPTYLNTYDLATEALTTQLKEGEKQSPPLSAAEQKKLSDEIAGRNYTKAILLKTPIEAPDTLVSTEMHINLGDFPVVVKHFGKGNTSGDLAVILKKQHILCTGDLVVSPVPYLGGGFPESHQQILTHIAKQKYRYLIPGHGNILSNNEHVLNVASLIARVRGIVAREITKYNRRPSRFNEMLSAVKPIIEKEKWIDRFCADIQEDREFFVDFSLTELVRAVHAEVWRR